MNNTFDLARENMVKSQILTNKITDKNVIDSFLTIPKHEFLPENLKNIAYCDKEIEINNERVVLSPMVIARMMQALGLKKGDVVLNVASGIGYSSALIAHIAGRVVAVEYENDFMSKANSVLRKLGYDNVIIISNDPMVGNADGGPYDAAFINTAVSEVSDTIFEQLKEGGKLVAVIQKNVHNAVVVLYKKEGEKISSTELFDVNCDKIGL